MMLVYLTNSVLLVMSWWASQILDFNRHFTSKLPQ